jgi:hypothetical protein
LIRLQLHAPDPILAEAISVSADQCQTAGSITKQFDFIINSATYAVSKKCDLKLPRSASFNYFVAESIIITGIKPLPCVSVHKRKLARVSITGGRVIEMGRRRLRPYGTRTFVHGDLSGFGDAERFVDSVRC